MDPNFLIIQTLVSHLSSHSDHTRVAALRQLRHLSNQHPAARRHIISSSNALPLLVNALYSSSHPIQDHAATTLLNLSISDRRPLISTPGLLDAVAHILCRHADSSISAAAVQSAAATLHSLLAAVPEFRPVVGARLDILHALVDIIRSNDSPSRSVKDGLKASFGAALYPPNRAVMVRIGFVAALFAILAKEKSKKNGIVEDATAVIAQIAGCDESDEAIRAVLGVAALSGLLGSDNVCCSLRTKENAVSGLLNLVRCGGEETVKEVRERAVGDTLEGIVFVEEHGSAKGKSKAVALLKAVLDDGSNDKSFGDLYPI